MRPIVRGAFHGWTLRVSVALTFSAFLGVQASAWERSSTTFHDLASQPAPLGSYLRRTLREHFPVWWSSVSALHANEYSLPEMNECDKGTIIQKPHTGFDAKILRREPNRIVIARRPSR